MPLRMTSGPLPAPSPSRVRSLVMVLVAVCAATAHMPVARSQTLASDKAALLALLRRAPSLPWNALTDPCGGGDPARAWVGVTCDPELSPPRVTTLWLNSTLNCTIPPDLGNLTALTTLRMEYTALFGGLPVELARLRNLDVLWLWANNLMGKIPPQLGSLASLRILVLGKNHFTGPIPPELGRLVRLTRFDLSFNFGLTGPIPASVGNLTRLVSLFVNSNLLSGSLPEELGRLGSLYEIGLSVNALTGPILPGFANLTNLTYFWANQNDFSGPIPPALGDLPLKLLYLQDNPKLTGPIPWQFATRPGDFVFSSSLPYAAVPPSPPPPPSGKRSAKTSSKLRWPLIGVGLAVGVLGCVGVAVCVVLYCWQGSPWALGKGGKRGRPFGLDVGGPQAFTYEELQRAANGFSPESVLGRGGQGSIHRGTLPGGEQVAIKHIIAQNAWGEKSFKAEAMTLGHVDHRHICRVLGWCVDRKRGSFLVYEHVENSSLDKWLFPNEDESRRPLTWKERYQIATDTAKALAFLHDGKDQVTVHRDIKPGNLLLDSDFRVKIGDFGLAESKTRAPSDRDVMVTSAGTMGYLAPETLLGKQLLNDTTDVYSYGIVVLEIIAGRPVVATSRPFEEIFLLQYAWSLHEQDKAVDLVDERLEGVFDEAELKTLLAVGLACTVSSAKARPTMERVYQLLTAGKDQPAPLPAQNPYVLYNSNHLTSLNWSSVFNHPIASSLYLSHCEGQQTSRCEGQQNSSSNFKVSRGLNPRFGQSSLRSEQLPEPEVQAEQSSRSWL